MSWSGPAAGRSTTPRMTAASAAAGAGEASCSRDIGCKKGGGGRFQASSEASPFLACGHGEHNPGASSRSISHLAMVM